MTRTLMEALPAHARESGITRISLSADEDNPACRLYSAPGYREYEPGDGKDRMLLERGLP